MKGIRVLRIRNPLFLLLLLPVIFFAFLLLALFTLATFALGGRKPKAKLKKPQPPLQTGDVIEAEFRTLPN